jgi:hypothetical protein
MNTISGLNIHSFITGSPDPSSSNFHDIFLCCKACAGNVAPGLIPSKLIRRVKQKAIALVMSNEIIPRGCL